MLIFLDKKFCLTLHFNHLTVNKYIFSGRYILAPNSGAILSSVTQYHIKLKVKLLWGENGCKKVILSHLNLHYCPESRFRPCSISITLSLFSVLNLEMLNVSLALLRKMSPPCTSSTGSITMSLK